MMQFIRERAKGILSWVIIAVVAFVFTFWGISGYFGQGANPVLAVVNGHEVTSYEVDEYFNRWLRMNAMNQDFDINLINPILIKQQIMRALVEQQAVLTSLRRAGYVVSDNTLIESIQANPNYQEDKKFSIERYKLALSQFGMSENAFEQAQRDDILVNQFQTAVAASSFALPMQADFFLSIRDQKRDFGYSIISAKNYLSSAKVTQEEIADYFEKNQATFIIPEQVKLDYVELSMEDLMRKVSVSEQNLADYYEQNMQSFSEPDLINIRHIMVEAPKQSDLDKGGEAEERINDIHARITQGEDFTVIAKQESDDASSAEDGGDLGWISRNDDYPAEVYALKNPGDVTTPVQTDWGWHVFQLVDRKGGTVRQFDDVKSVVAERFRREAAEKIFVTKGEELANIAFENPGSLLAVSEQLDLPIKTTEFFPRSGGPGIAAAGNVIKAAFSEDVLKQRNNSDLLRISDDSYVVVRLNENKAQYQETLDEVKPRIKEILQNQAAEIKAKEVGEKLEQELKDGKLPNKAVATYNLDWSTHKDVERDNRKLNKNVVQYAFSMPRPGDSPSISGWNLPNGDYLVVALTKVVAGKIIQDADSGLQDMVVQQINSMEARRQVAAAQRSLVEQASIEYKNQE